MTARRMLTLGAALALALPLAAQAAPAMRVVRDPQTGELRAPNAAEVAAFQKAEAQLREATRAGKQRKAGAETTLAATGPQEITHPDGSVELQLDEDSMLFSVATIGADGQVRTHCLPAQEAKALVKSSKKFTAAKAGAKGAQ